MQRVKSARVEVDGEVVGAIDRGLLVYLGFGKGDTAEDRGWVLSKIVGLRVFEDDAGKMNLSVQDVGGALLLVSQFTLYGDVRRGRRPSFDDAMPPEQARSAPTTRPCETRARGPARGDGPLPRRHAGALDQRRARHALDRLASARAAARVDTAAVPEEEQTDPVLEALWKRVLDAWDDDKTHAALLDHAMRSQALPEIAGPLPALTEDPRRAQLAKKKLDAIVLAATQMLLSMKTPKPGKTPLPITLSAVRRVPRCSSAGSPGSSGAATDGGESRRQHRWRRACRARRRSRSPARS